MNVNFAVKRIELTITKQKYMGVVNVSKKAVGPGYLRLSTPVYCSFHNHSESVAHVNAQKVVNSMKSEVIRTGTVSSQNIPLYKISMKKHNHCCKLFLYFPVIDWRHHALGTPTLPARFIILDAIKYLENSFLFWSSDVVWKTQTEF